MSSLKVSYKIKKSSLLVHHNKLVLTADVLQADIKITNPTNFTAETENWGLLVQLNLSM